jgi:hypothetical protein
VKNEERVPSQKSGARGSPSLKLSVVGDGEVFYRTLAKIVVRREMIIAGIIPDPAACDSAPDTP